VKVNLPVNGVILFFNETYISITISMLLNIRRLRFENYGETLCSLFTILLFFITVGFPIFTAVFFTKNFVKLKE
jgi:hypothetical protein